MIAGLWRLLLAQALAAGRSAGRSAGRVTDPGEQTRAGEEGDDRW